MHNLAYAINGRDGIHSFEYCQEVLKRLQAADLRGPKWMKAALKEMKRKLELGEVFW